MKIIADLRAEKLYIGDAHYRITCDVRTIKNKQRGYDEVIRSMPEDMPYDPCLFPKGLWKIFKVEWQEEKKFNYDLYGPVKIFTDAYQMVNVWELDDFGHYLRETSKQTRDCGYLLHWGKSRTTWGCIRLSTPEEAITLGRLIERLLNENSGPVDLEVL